MISYLFPLLLVTRLVGGSIITATGAPTTTTQLSQPSTTTILSSYDSQDLDQQHVGLGNLKEFQPVILIDQRQTLKVEAQVVAFITMISASTHTTTSSTSLLPESPTISVPGAESIHEEEGLGTALRMKRLSGRLSSEPLAVRCDRREGIIASLLGGLIVLAIAFVLALSIALCYKLLGVCCALLGLREASR